MHVPWMLTNIFHVDHYYSHLFRIWKMYPRIQSYFMLNTLWPGVAYINGLVQYCSISIANAAEILQSCTEPLICITELSHHWWSYGFSPLSVRCISNCQLLVILFWSHCVLPSRHLVSAVVLFAYCSSHMCILQHDIEPDWAWLPSTHRTCWGAQNYPGRKRWVPLFWFEFSSFFSP